MEQFVGLDVSQETTHVCVVDSQGKMVWQGKCLSTPEAVADVIKERARKAVRMGLESGPLSTWLWHSLSGMGLPITCLDARHAKAALNMQVNKTDKNDAAGIAHIVRTGWYREVQVKSMDSHSVRAMLGTRSQLVGIRTDLRNQIRGVLKTFGIVLGKKGGRALEQQVRELKLGNNLLNEALGALMMVLHSVCEQISKLDRIAHQHAKQHMVCRHLMGIPGVGPMTAAAFVTAIDDPGKFRKSKSVGAFLGLTPRSYQSGEIDVSGRISKCGDQLARTYLYEAASSLLTRVKKWSALKAWGLRIAKRSGMRKAKVAVARKLAVIMHQMWTTGEAFRWSNAEAPAG